MYDADPSSGFVFVSCNIMLLLFAPPVASLIWHICPLLIDVGIAKNPDWDVDEFV